MHIKVNTMDNLLSQCMGSFWKSGFIGWSGFNFPTELEKNCGFWVDKAGARYFPSGFKYIPNTNPHWEWGCVLEGIMEIRAKGIQYKIQPGDFYVISPDCEVTANPIIKPFLIWFEFNGDKVDGFTKLCGFKDNAITVGVAKLSQAKHVVNIANLLHEHPSGYQLMVHHNLWGFMVASQETEHRFELSYDIAKTLDYIKLKSVERFSLQDLADISGLSQQNFRKQFLRQVGEPPIRYVLKTKIKLAKELLILSEMSIKQIAIEVGIDDPYYFSRIFKKYEGISPEFYRNSFHPGIDNQ